MKETSPKEDPTQNILMDEFGAYLGVIANGFTSKMHELMKRAEGELLVHVGNCQRELATSNREGADRIAAQHSLIEKKLKSFGAFVQQLETDVEASRRNFEAAILKELTGTLQKQTATLQKENEQLRSELQALQLNLSKLTRSVTSDRTWNRLMTLIGTLAMLISMVLLWKVWH